VVAPILISPAAVLPEGEAWAFEVNWDGMRALVSVDLDVRVYRRHGSATPMATTGSQRLFSRGTNWGESQRTCLRQDH
jgi:hypothetical protein